MATTPIVRPDVRCRSLRKVPHSTNRKGHQAAKEADKQMATIAFDYGGASEAWKHVSSHGQPESDEGIALSSVSYE